MAKYLVKSGDSLSQLANGSAERFEQLIQSNSEHRNIKLRSRDDRYFAWLDVGECIEIPWRIEDDPECQSSKVLPDVEPTCGDGALDSSSGCRKCAIHVLVEDMVTAEPIASAALQLSPGAQTQTSDEDGNASFHFLLDRDYAISVTAEGYKAKIVTLPSRCDGNEDAVTISLEKEQALLVIKVEGPAEAVFSDTVTYTVTEYNRTEVSAQDKQRVKWKREYLSVAEDGSTTVVKSDSANDYTGEQYIFEAPRNSSEDWDALRIYAYVEKPVRRVSVFTELHCLPAPIAVSSLAEAFDPKRAEALKKRDSLYRVGGCILIALFRNPTQMQPFLRDQEELFTDTVSREGRDQRHCVIINGVVYDVSFLGKLDAADGNDPVAADATTVEGQVVAGSTTGGEEAPLMFYMLESGGSYSTGFGNLPAGTTSGFGGAGPLIINSLPYDSVNVYATGAPAGAPSSGEPGPKYSAYLRQRSNNTYKDWDSKPGGVGKAIVAYRNSDGAVAVIVQPNSGACSHGIQKYRDALVSAGFSDAVFVDGSDSVLFYTRGGFLITPGDNKNETNTMGIGIRCR